jgi:chorismate mutase
VLITKSGSELIDPVAEPELAVHPDAVEKVPLLSTYTTLLAVMPALVTVTVTGCGNVPVTGTPFWMTSTPNAVTNVPPTAET